MRVGSIGAGLVCLLWAGQAISSVCVAAPAQALPDRLPVPEWLLSSPRGHAACLDAATFLARHRAQQAAPGAPRASAGLTPGSNSATGYVPKTRDDNTPWRFDMNQNGRRMTAAEFDAWMNAKGIRVATGKPAVVAAGAASAASSHCPAGETVNC